MERFTRASLFAIFLLFPSLLVHGQISITGKVIADKTHEELAGAQVFIKNENKGTVTDAHGNFTFDHLDYGEHVLEVSFIGYETISKKITIPAYSEIIVNLTPGVIQLSDVVVNANADRPLNTLSRVDIQIRPANTSQDILRMVPGLFIAQHGGGGKAEQIFLRGFDIDHGTDINLSADGMPVNMVSHAHGQGYSDLHFLIPELISFVDFDKGPYYGDKGDFTTAGFVEFNSKSHLEKSFIKTEGARFGTWRGVAGINLLSPNHSKSSAYVASEVFRSNGYFVSPQDFSRVNISSRFNSRLTSKDNLAVGASIFTSSWDASGQIPERAVRSGKINRFGHIDNTEGGETSRANVFLKHIHESNNAAFFEQQFYAIYYDFNLFSNFTFFLNDPENGDQINQREARTIYGYRAAVTRPGKFMRIPVTTEIGAGFRYDDINDIMLSHAVKRRLGKDKQRGDINEININAYLSETIRFSEKWTVNAAMRIDNFYFRYLDKINNTDRVASKTNASPKLNINYKINNTTDIYARSGVGFHSNDARVVTAYKNENILPQAFGIDLGLNTKIGERLLLNAAIWRLDLEQEFVYVGDEGIVEAGKSTTRQGIDLSVRYQILPWLFVDGDINLTKPRIKKKDPGHYVPLAPVNATIGGITTRFNSGLNASLRYRYLGDRPANEDYSITAGGYFLVDAVIDYAFGNFEIRLSAENIFDSEWNEAQFETESRLAEEMASYSEIHFTPGSPLSLKMGLSLLF